MPKAKKKTTRKKTASRRKKPANAKFYAKAECSEDWAKDLAKSCGSGNKKSKVDKHCTGGGCGYFLGFIGAAVYYISTATGFWNGVWGVIKALVWPAFLVFELLKSLGM